MEGTAVVVLAMLLAMAGGNGRGVDLMKCCDVNEVLDGAAAFCVPAPWPPYALQFPGTNETADASWLARWVPPGLPLEDVQKVTRSDASLASLSHTTPVRTSALFDDRYRDRAVFPRPDVARFKQWQAIRYLIDGYQSHWRYCIDAALAPFPAPFALRLPPPPCRSGECVAECCPGEDYLKNVLGPLAPSCAKYGSSFVAVILRCSGGKRTVRRLTSDERPAVSADHWLSTTTSCVDTNTKASMTLTDDGHHFVVECRHPRITRFLYWLTRPLSFVAILLLATALATVASKERLRKSVHGWALASHAGCLLAFNTTQVAFYLSVSDQVDASPLMPEIAEETCFAFAFCAYFLLTAAACWLTAVCWNLSRGFKISPLPRAGGERRTFLKLSAFAWGTPLVLTAICVSAHVTQRRVFWQNARWFQPSLLETRTCFREAHIMTSVALGPMGTANKWGTAVYFYTPMAVLCLINIGCIGRTIRKVQFLKRGNSILKKEVGEGAEGHSKRETGHSEEEKGNQRTGVGATSQHKRATIYVKLILGAGVVELAAETMAWATSRYSHIQSDEHTFYTFAFLDQALTYRAVGYCADVMRASIVLWLAAPDSGDARALWRCLNPIWRLLKPIWRLLKTIWRCMRSIRQGSRPIWRRM